MPLFKISRGTSLQGVAEANFSNEKILQKLVEANLGTVFNCRFVASEFQTGIQHGGRIDTLALSEDANPVIIEYKKNPSSELVTQSLYYLAWIHDHKGDFEIAARKALGARTAVDWDDVRVICIAPSYKKFDLHAVRVMGTSIELWTYRLFDNDTLYLEEVQQKELVANTEQGPPYSKSSSMMAASRKAAQSRKTSTYTFEQHLENKPANVRELMVAIQEYVLSLNDAIEERPKKLYVAYRTTQNIVCVEPQQRKVSLFLKVDPKKISLEEGFARDVTNVGHFGTGNVEVTIASSHDFERAKPLIQKAYENVGS